MDEALTIPVTDTANVAVVNDAKGVITRVTVTYNRSLPKPQGFSKVGLEITYEPQPGEVFDAAFIQKKLKGLQALVQSEVRKDK